MPRDLSKIVDIGHSQENWMFAENLGGDLQRWHQNIPECLISLLMGWLGYITRPLSFSHSLISYLNIVRILVLAIWKVVPNLPIAAPEIRPLGVGKCILGPLSPIEKPVALSGERVDLYIVQLKSSVFKNYSRMDLSCAVSYGVSTVLCQMKENTLPESSYRLGQTT